MNVTDWLATQFDQEMKTTRRHLERLPADKFDWRPHEKSYTVLALASHIVECVPVPGSYGPTADEQF